MDAGPGSPPVLRSRRLDAGAVATGAAFVALGLVALGEAYVLSSDPDANRLHQTLRPGLYVSFLGGILVLAGLAFLWRNAAAAGRVAKPAREAATRQAIPLVLSLTAYALLIERLGYVVASVPFFLAVLRLFGIRSWLLSGALSVAFTVAFYVLFVRYLGVILPRGILEGTT